MPSQFRCLACKAVIYQINQRLELWWNEHCGDIVRSNAPMRCPSNPNKKKELYVMCHGSISISFASSRSHELTIYLDLRQMPGAETSVEQCTMRHKFYPSLTSWLAASISTYRLRRFTLFLLIFDQTTSEDASSWLVPAGRHTSTHS